jgi:hypothetical protein
MNDEMSLGRRWVLALFGLGLVLIVIVLIVRVSSNAHETSSGGAATGSGGASAAQYDQVQAGMTQAQVTNLLGQPDKKSQDQSDGSGTAECWYYDAAGGGTYQVCFEGETVAYKSGSGTKAAPAPSP